jgi:hypothetical protein
LDSCRKHLPSGKKPPFLGIPLVAFLPLNGVVAIHRGIIVIIGLGMAATYTGYVIGQFKAQYPHVHNMADAGEVLLGVIGREVFGVAQIIFLVFIMGSHILTFSIMLNVLSNHGACTILFAVIGMIVSIIFSLPRTLKNVSYFSIACEY